MVADNVGLMEINDYAEQLGLQESKLPQLGSGVKYLLCSPLLGEDFHFDYIIFFKGVGTTN